MRRPGFRGLIRTEQLPSAYDRVVPVFVEMVKALLESEIVRINVRDAQQEAEVRALLGNGPAGRVEFFDVPTNEPWCRDHGPIFLKRKERPRLAAVNFGFNAWGYKLSPFEEDDAAAMLMAAKIGVPVFDFGEFVLEGVNRREWSRHGAYDRIMPVEPKPQP